MEVCTEVVVCQEPAEITGLDTFAEGAEALLGEQSREGKII